MEAPSWAGRPVKGHTRSGASGHVIGHLNTAKESEQ